MKVKDIMIKRVVSISADTSAKIGMDLLQKMRISGLPVIDKNKKLLGMFTEKDILSYILPSYVGRVGRFIYEENPKSTRKKLSELENISVSQLMRKEVITATEELALCEIAKIMLLQKARRIPVLDEAGRVVGIISRGDVLKAFAKEACSLKTGR
ncbi:MAG: CBS domain-containing protein [Candidatus Omnitrophota bacterium]